MGRAFEQILGQIVSMRENTLRSTNLVASRHMESENDSLPVNVHPSKTSLLKLPSPHHPPPQKKKAITSHWGRGSYNRASERKAP